MSLDAPLNGAADWTEPGPQTLISTAELDRLEELEQTIDVGLGSFIEVGRALAEVRDSRLYRGSHPTFEAYCDQRWQISRRRAYDLMDSAGVVCAMAHTDAPLPTNERQARALAAAPPEERADVMAAVAGKGKPTAAAIAEEVESRKPDPLPQPAVYCPAAGDPPPQASGPAVEDVRPEPVPAPPAPAGADDATCSVCGVEGRVAGATIGDDGKCVDCRADDDLCHSCGEVKPGAAGGWCPECWQSSEAATQPAPKPKAEKKPSEKAWEPAKAIDRAIRAMPSAREAMAVLPADSMKELDDIADRAVEWGKRWREERKAAQRLRLMGVK